MTLNESFNKPSTPGTNMRLAKLNAVPSTDDLSFALSLAGKNPKNVVELPWKSATSPVNYLIKVTFSSGASDPTWMLNVENDEDSPELWNYDTGDASLIHSLITAESERATYKSPHAEPELSVDMAVAGGGNGSHAPASQQATHQSLFSLGSYQSGLDKGAFSGALDQFAQIQKPESSVTSLSGYSPGSPAPVASPVEPLAAPAPVAPPPAVVPAIAPAPAIPAAPQQPVVNSPFSDLSSAAAPFTNRSVSNLPKQTETVTDPSQYTFDSPTPAAAAQTPVPSDGNPALSAANSMASSTASSQTPVAPAKPASQTYSDLPQIKALPNPINLDRSAVDSVYASFTNADTGFISHAAFLFFLVNEFGRFQREPKPLSVVRFTLILKTNDATLQPLPVPAIKEAGRRMFSIMRSLDWVAHYDFEFAILLPYTNRQQASEIVHKIAHAIGSAPLLPGLDPRQVGCHFGIACMPDDCSHPGVLLAAAEEAKNHAQENQLAVTTFADY